MFTKTVWQLTVGQEVVGIASQIKSECAQRTKKRHRLWTARISSHRNGNPPKPILTVNFRTWSSQITRNEHNQTNTRRDRALQKSCPKSWSNPSRDLCLRVLARRELWSTLSLRVVVRFCSFRAIPCVHDLKFPVSIGFGGFPFLWKKIGANVFF